MYALYLAWTHKLSPNDIIWRSITKIHVLQNTFYKRVQVDFFFCLSSLCPSMFFSYPLLLCQTSYYKHIMHKSGLTTSEVSIKSLWRSIRYMGPSEDYINRRKPTTKNVPMSVLTIKHECKKTRRIYSVDVCR